MNLALWLHLTGMTAWIGGMFFANMALRPAAAQLLQPPQRLPLLAGVMSRFLAWVAGAIVVIFASGGWMMLAGGAAMTAPVRAMAGIAVVMTLIYLYIVGVPFRALKAGVAAANWPAAGAAMGVIRQLIVVNLLLGIAALAAAVLLR